MKRLVLVLLSLALIVSCKKKEEETPNPDNNTKGNPTPIACSDIVVNTTWTNREADPEKADYIIDCMVLVEDGILTIEPGVRIVFSNSEAGLLCEENGAIKMLGTSALPIILEGEESAKGSWHGVIYGSNTPSNQMEYVTIRHAGSGAYNSGYPAGLSLGGYDGGQRLSISNCTITDNLNYGVFIEKLSNLTKIENCQFTNNEKAGLKTWLEAIAKMDTLSDYETGNGYDYIEVYETGDGAGNVSQNLTIKGMPTPMRVAERIRFNGSGYTLTINAGAVLKMAPSVEIDMDGCLLRVLGTATHYVTFEGSSEGKGSWVGINIRNSGNNLMKYCIVDGGGSESPSFSDGQGGIVLGDFGSSGDKLTIQNCTIKNCENTGIAKKSNSVVTASSMLYANNGSPSACNTMCNY
jgi:hypothetical protein